MSDFSVAIIGAGLSGLSLALSLHKHNIACTLYEARDAPLNTGGGVMLQANGLKVLEAIDVYDSVAEQAYSFDTGYFQLGPTGAIVETIEFGNETKYGKHAFRVYRYTLLNELLKKVRHYGIPIHFNRPFSHIVEETSERVTWQFADGSSASASILVGADGIHSSVRKYLAPEIKPAFGGNIFLVAAVPTAQLGLPKEDLKDLRNASNKHPMPSGIIAPQFGAFIFAPQSKNGDEVMISAMRSYPQEPKHWAPIDKDKDLLRSMFRENEEKFPDIVRNAVANIPGEQLRIWPSYHVPLLESWTSAKTGNAGHGRVVVLGDAAHALPPAAGQGVNMAFEDVYTFAGILKSLGANVDSKHLQKALRGWQSFRQERVDCVMRLNQQMELRRMPAAAKANGTDPESLKASMGEEFAALYTIDVDEAVKECLKKGRMK